MSPGYFPLRDAIDRLFESSFIAPQSLAGQMSFPPAGVRATDDDVVVELAIPGAKPEDINISVTGDTVNITGDVKHEHRQTQKGQMYVDEMFHGQFQRSFTLPFPVDANNTSATFENGILSVTLPKSEAVKPRRIQVTQQGRSTAPSPSTAGTVEKESIPISGE
jgi:HSP20 family protein